MTDYKKALLAIAENYRKDFFSKEQTHETKVLATKLFVAFIEQLDEKSDLELQYLFLKILGTEGVMIYGNRLQEKSESDA